MKYKAKLPEDMIPSGQDYMQLPGKETIRKGTMAAMIANLDIIEADGSNEAEKESAFEVIKTIVPSMVAVGLAKYFSCNNSKVQSLLDKYGEQN